MIGVFGAAFLMLLGIGPLAALFDEGGSQDEGEDQDSSEDSGVLDPSTDLLAGETVAGTDQPDLLELAAGVDSVSGGAGDDTLVGTEADSWVESDLESSTLDGGAGDDTIILTDHITAIGGEGADSFVLGSSAFNEGNVIADFAPGEDTISVDLEGATSLPDLRIEDTEDGDAEIFVDETLLARVTGASGQITSDDIEFINADFVTEGTEGDDTLSGGAGADTLDGSGGDDFIRLGAGDVGIGGDGNDTFEVSGDTVGELSILDFSPAEDVLLVEYYSNEGTWPAPEFQISQNEEGFMQATSNNGMVVNLVGVSAGFTLDHIVMVEV